MGNKQSGKSPLNYSSLSLSTRTSIVIQIRLIITAPIHLAPIILRFVRNRVVETLLLADSKIIFPFYYLFLFNISMVIGSRECNR